MEASGCATAGATSDAGRDLGREASAVTLLVTHPDCLLHDPGPGHPESPDRLRAVLAALDGAAFRDLGRAQAPEAGDADILRAHAPEHLARVEAAIPASGHWNVEAETVVSPGSLAAARRAAGAVCLGIDAVCAGQARNAFCAVRPPGHHAERSHPMGFCLFNNAAIGALRARALHGCRRVAILDVDVHHGNGAQNIFWDDRDALVVSVHRFPSDLPTGDVDERGRHGQVVDLPLAAGADGAAFRALLSGPLAERVRLFRPDIVVAAAGFDGHRSDPIGGLRLETEDYGWAGAFLTGLARDVCGGRLVASLEGGYDLDALAAATAAFVAAMMGGGGG